MKKSFNFTITEELRNEYEKFLRGEKTMEDVRVKYAITQYQIMKLFDMMYFEKTKELNYIKV